jgi:heat shock protein HslJ
MRVSLFVLAFFTLLCNPAVGAEVGTDTWSQAGKQVQEAAGAVGEATTESAQRGWEATKDYSESAWKQLQKDSGQAWEKTKDFSERSWDKARETYQNYTRQSPAPVEAPLEPQPHDLNPPAESEDMGNLSVGALQGTSWTLSEQIGMDGKKRVPQGSSGASFEDGRISGSAGCNRYFAKVEDRGRGVISIGPVGVTRMACPQPLMDQEQSFLDTLARVDRFGFQLGDLVLSGPSGTLVLSPQTGGAGPDRSPPRPTSQSPGGQGTNGMPPRP